MNGFAVINKPLNLSSSDVVIRCRNALSKAISSKIKCGHMGTLDPMASGVLIVAFGNATRLFDFLLEKQKGYKTTFVFGEERDTLDSAGQIIATSDLPLYEHISNNLSKFVGEIDQVPPKYSAVNINGRRAYDLARKGQDFEIKSKKVKIFSIVELDKLTQDNLCKSITLDIECGGGTYIRSICRDLAYLSSSVGYMSELERTSCGGYTLDGSTSLEDFLSNPTQFVKPTIELLQKIMPVVTLNDVEYKRIRNGMSSKISLADGNYGAIYQDKLSFVIKVESNVAKSICFLED